MAEMTEQEQVCRNCGEPIVEGPSGFWSHKAGHACCGPNQFADPTASHYESASAAKEDADALNAAERPEQTAHTPLPWRYQEVSDAYTHIIRGPNNEFLCSGPQDSSGETEARMRFIVTACNNYEALKQSHDALVEALKKVDAEVGSIYNPSLEAAGSPRMKAIGNALEITTEALANAKALTEIL